MTQTEARQTALTVIEDWKADEEPKKVTFAQLISAMQAQDDGMLNLDFDDFKRLVEATSLKVDDLYYALGHIEARADYLEEQEKQIAAEKKHLRSEVKRLKEYITFWMQQTETTELPGKDVHLKLCRAKPSVQISAEPTPEMILEFGDYIRTKYEWDKTAIFEGFAAGDEKLAEFASLKETMYPKFTRKLRAKK